MGIGNTDKKQNQKFGLPAYSYIWFHFMHLFSPQHSPNKFGSALGLSKRLAQYTPARECSNKFDIPLAYSQFGFAQYTPARQCSNKFGIALAYAYFCPTEK